MPEILENPEKFRYTIEPIEYHDIWNFCMKARESQWTEEEIKEEMAKDQKGWATLEDDVKHFILSIVAFFAISDGAVNEVISDDIQSRIYVREALVWYNLQAAGEDVHSIVYSQLVDTYAGDSNEKRKIFDSISTFPTIKNKIAWLHKHVGKNNVYSDIPQSDIQLLNNICEKHKKVINLVNNNGSNAANIDKINKIQAKLQNSNKVPLAKVILANAIMEGLFFSSSFCAIFWVNHYYKGILPGLAKANEWISRDEGMHTDFAILLYRKYITDKLPENEVHIMFREAVEIEIEFIEYAMPKKLKGMSADLMIEYVKFVADGLLNDLGYSSIFNILKNPCDFMNKQSISVRIPDFFSDQSVSEYGLAINDGLGFTDGGIDENF